LLESALAELSARNMGTALFCEPVVSDRLLANQLRGLFNLIQYSDNLLERETTFLSVLSQLLIKHAKQPYQLEKLGKEPKAVKIVKDYLDAHFVDNISTRELANLAGLNPYYLTRLFQSSVGLPPHAYQIQKRLNCAKNLLRAGQGPLDTALFCGFTDQSHLHRHFKKYLGLGPGAFQRSSKLHQQGLTID
jgi:AraC-like DNA-binding protein